MVNLNSITREEVLDGFAFGGVGESLHCLGKLARAFVDDDMADTLFAGCDEALQEDGVFDEDVDLAIEMLDRDIPNAEAALLVLRSHITPHAVRFEKRAAAKLGLFIRVAMVPAQVTA